MFRILLAILFITGPVWADDIKVMDSYARVVTPAAKAGAIYLELHNHAEGEDRLIGVSSPFAKRTQLHTHVVNDEGVAKMLHVEDGFAISADGHLSLAPGGDHVMLMGLTESLEQGDMIPLVLEFEKAGEVTLEVMVDLERDKDGHSSHSH